MWLLIFIKNLHRLNKVRTGFQRLFRIPLAVLILFPYFARVDGIFFQSF